MIHLVWEGEGEGEGEECHGHFPDLTQVPVEAAKKAGRDCRMRGH